MRLACAGAVVSVVLAARTASAQADPPAAHDDAQFDIMNVLSNRGLHDLNHERWNAYGQFTYISSFKLPFQAPYTNANGSNHSLGPDYERSFTASLTLFLGAKLWHGAEAYVNPELISERPLSGLTGIGGSIQNFELQKQGSETPQVYRARLFLRQTFDLGGKKVVLVSNPNQLGTTVSTRRLVLTFGNFTALDVFDKNNVIGDARRGFLNMAFMTHSSWDFPADARGYTYGLAGELYWDDWVVRAGRFLPPQVPNSSSIDFRFWDVYGDAFELEHDHVLSGQPGVVRVLVYRNRTFSGRFDDAIAAFQAGPGKNAGDCPSTSYNYGSRNFTAPDLCWVRRNNSKLGIGVNLEQYLAKDVGVFARAMISDGQSEVDAFNPADRDLSVGALAKGTLWRRPFDVTGLGFALAWISDVHAKYLAMGGVDGFVGDGHLHQAPEAVLDAFYAVNLFKAIWLTADYQLLMNPGFNRDRGPVHILGARGHAEF